MPLLLFDIDGTLLLGATDAHRDALHAALREVYGVEDPEVASLDPSGRTDGEIARLILTAHGLSAGAIDGGAAELREATCRAYAASHPEDLSATVAPGMRALLSELADRDDTTLALLTGNFEAVARTKLARAGMGGFFRPGQGAFGSDGERREDLPAIARARAGGDGPPWPREDTWVIGDTPRDVACARADGVRCLAVATGRYGPDELRAADGVARDAVELRRLLSGRA